MTSPALAPQEVLFAVNSKGRVLYLNSCQSQNNSDDIYNNSRWLELPYLGIDFKRVSSCFPSSDSNQSNTSGSGGRLWALGGDHQIYVFAFGAEVPIRAKEVIYVPTYNSMY